MKIDHVGIAVDSIDKAITLYRDAFGLTVSHREEVPAQNVRVAFLKGAESSAEEAQVELLEPIGDGAVAKFLKTRGPGMHHIAFKTHEISNSMQRLKEKGLPALEDAPRPGSRGHKVCFIHPKHTAGVLVELIG